MLDSIKSITESSPAGPGDDGESLLDQLVSRKEVSDLFRVILRREYGNDFSYADTLVNEKYTLKRLLRELLRSKEFESLTRRKLFESKTSPAGSPYYRVPADFAVTKKEAKDVLLVGSCLMDLWTSYISEQEDGVRLEKLIFYNASKLPDLDAGRISKYAYQICQIGLRSVLAEQAYFETSLDNAKLLEQRLKRAKELLSINIEAISIYNTKYNILTYFLNFVTPQQNPVGRMQDRYSLSNPVYFIEQLNQHFFETIFARKNCYLIDLDQIASNFGKKYVSDDLISHLNHGSLLVGLALAADKQRLASIGDVEALYSPNVPTVIKAIVAEAEANTRTIEQIDSVKLVIFDLDDTLWRGVAAEQDLDAFRMTEGWPLSIVEAASFLWQRGILIAIVSKNDEKTTLATWNELYGSRFSIDNFVATRINWKPKAENIREILDSVNLLPSSTLFVDDNPVERAAVKAAFPDIRVMDAPVALWRRLLLWAPELQRSVITAESMQRTEMIHAQIEREDERQTLDHAAFLATLNIDLRPSQLTATDQPRFPRCFELLNKTNQFNTTGKRWSEAEITQFFSSGGRFLAFDVQDRFTSYGMTALMLIHDDTIEQFVLSCRVFGMEVEKACVAIACASIAESGAAVVKGRIQPSGKNILSLTIYADERFADAGDGVWILEGTARPAIPAHISVSAA